MYPKLLCAFVNRPSRAVPELLAIVKLSPCDDVRVYIGVYQDIDRISLQLCDILANTANQSEHSIVVHWRGEELLIRNSSGVPRIEWGTDQFETRMTYQLATATPCQAELVKTI